MRLPVRVSVNKLNFVTAGIMHSLIGVQCVHKQPEYQPFLGKKGKDGSEKGRELFSPLPLPPPPSKISSPLAPQEGLILRLVQKRPKFEFLKGVYLRPIVIVRLNTFMRAPSRFANVYFATFTRNLIHYSILFSWINRIRMNQVVPGEVRYQRCVGLENRSCAMVFQATTKWFR